MSNEWVHRFVARGDGIRAARRIPISAGFGGKRAHRYKAKVESQVASPEVLDATRFPEIRFTADRLVPSADKSEEFQGTVFGKLSLHGVTRPLEFPVHVWRRGDARVVLGKVSFNQSDFGISPLRKAGGAIAVEDRVLVDFALRLQPAR